jgi:CBS domain-containing protein
MSQRLATAKNTLRDLGVQAAMRRQVVQLPQSATIDRGIASLIKYKISALLTTDGAGRPAGVVSKTDIVGAYYAGLPIDSPLAHIMSSPPLFCRPDQSLESALETMRTRRIYRLYVRTDDAPDLIGTLAYPDIVGLLYRYCHQCHYSKVGQQRHAPPDPAIPRYTVKEVMTASVTAVGRDEALNRVMEVLSAYRFGAVLIVTHDGSPCGVISKTDLVRAYRSQVSPHTPAGEIMSAPVRTCGETELLEDAIRTMILADIHRLFAHRQAPADIVGVLSLSDAARIRSGSCHACISSRIKLDAAH